MSRVRLLHWNANEAATYVELLQTAGYDVEYDHEFRPGVMRLWRESPPDAFVIDLSRLPSQGREIAVALRQSPATRRIPIVFCEGAEEKVSRIRAELPDAVYCRAGILRSALKRAIANPPKEPAKPTAMMDRYASKTVAQKLGIKESSTIALIDPPLDYGKVLGEVPAHVEFLENGGEPASVTLCFVREVHSLGRTLSEVRALAAASKLWILWPKKASQAGGTLTERLVREHAIELGLVDYKICSVNQVWSAMLFALKGQALKRGALVKQARRSPEK
jgi:CheY-like chemotaxis protein